MDITDINLFLQIVETNNITKTAERLHFSQSTVSYRIQAMEKELGYPLFSRFRGNRSIELTAQGEQFVDIAKQWINLVHETQAIKEQIQNRLTVASIDSASNTVLREVYKELLNREEPLQLHIITHQSQGVYDAVSKHIADVGIVSIPIQHKEVITSIAYRQKFYVVRRKNQPGPIGCIKPESLDPAWEIYQDWGYDYAQWHEYIWGTRHTYFAWIDTISLISQFLVNEKCWSLVPDAPMNELLTSQPDIQIDELQLDEEHTRVCYIVKHRNPKTSSIENIKLFEKILKELQL